MGVIRGLKQADLSGSGDGLGPAMYAQLAVDIAAMLLDRIQTDNQAIGDFAVGESLVDQTQDLFFALAQGIDK
jgi:hypothetical protein